MVVLAHREVDGGGGSTAEQGWRRCGSPAAVLRRVPAAFDRVYSTSERRGRFWWRPNKQWGSGMAWPRRARACRRQWRAANGEMGSGRARGLGAHFIGGKEREGELGREQPGQGAKPGEDAGSARGAAAILVARAGEERGGRGELRGAREGGLGQYQGRGSGFGRRRDAWGGQVAGAGLRRRRGHGAGKLEVGETVRGSVVNKSKFQNQF